MQGFACRIRSLNGFPCPFPIFIAAKKNGPPAAGVATTTSASDSNLRCCKEEWPACSGRGSNEVRIRFKSSLRQRRTASLQLTWQQRLPRPILIFFAATENGSACYGRSGLRGPHPILIFLAATENGSACSWRSDNDVRVRY